MHDARRFIDRYGFRWQVCELGLEGVAASPFTLADMPPATQGWLYFFSRGTTLVLRDYPAAWQELTWLELEQLRERARVLGSDTTIRIPQRDTREDTSATLR
jgi:hypothetical protein